MTVQKTSTSISEQALLWNRMGEETRGRWLDYVISSCESEFLQERYRAHYGCAMHTQEAKRLAYEKATRDRGKQ